MLIGKGKFPEAVEWLEKLENGGVLPEHMVKIFLGNAYVEKKGGQTSYESLHPPEMTRTRREGQVEGIHSRAE